MLFHEFALDPKVLSDWRSFRYFWDHFGVEQGRLISEFPRKWKRLVYDQLANSQDIRKKDIEERLHRIDKKLFRSKRCYFAERTWLENAEDQHFERPFRAVISDTNPRCRPFVKVADDLDEEDVQWKVTREQRVPRNAEALTECVTPLFSLARELFFVDPHFDPEATRFTDTLRRMLRDAWATERPFRKIQLHVVKPKSKPGYQPETPGCWRSKCEHRLPRNIPIGLSIRVVRWLYRDEQVVGDNPHARYLLTDVGGVRFDYGLDEGDAEGRTTDVSILDESLWKQRMVDYGLSDDGNYQPAFLQADPTDIDGCVMIKGTLQI